MEFARPRKPTCQQVIKRDKSIVIDLRLKQRHPTDILIKKKVFDQNVCLLTNLNSYLVNKGAKICVFLTFCRGDDVSLCEVM